MDWNNINRDRDTSGLGPIEYDQSKVPSLIRRHADNVRTKTYGQEVREAQARNAELAGLIASEANSKVDDQDAEIEALRARFNNAVSAVTVDSEVTDSRVSSDEVFPTLKDRLDNVDENIKHLSDNSVIVYPNGSDDTQNIQAAFDSLTNGGYLHLVDGKTYKIKSNVTLIQPITIIGHNAMLEYIGAGNDSMITFSSGYSGMRDVRVRKEKTIPGVVAFKFNKTIKGDVKNINFNDNCDFLKAFELFAVYDSNFANIRIKNNLTEYTGTIFEANYCVNNTVTNSVFGFANYGIHLTEVQNPNSKNRNEGVIVNGLTTYYCNYPIHAPNVTMLMIDNSILDFTQKTAINAGNGGGLYVTNTWVQVMHNDASTAVAISANFKGAKIDGLYVVGNKEHTGSQAFQIANKHLTIVKNVHLHNIRMGISGNSRDIIDVTDVEKIKNGTVGGYMRTGNGGGAGLLATTEQAFAFIYAVDALNINNYIIGWAHLQPGVSPRVRKLSSANLTFGVSNATGTQVIEGSTNIVSYAFITPISGINVNVETL